MKQLTLTIALVVSVITATMVDGTTELKADQDVLVTITNVTRGQIITPPVLLSHTKDFELFTVGEPAISELVDLAEDGNTVPLEGLLGSLSQVHDYTTSMVGLGPGESVTLQIETRGNFRNITAVGMLATTNDAFFAVDGASVPTSLAKRVYVGYAYDAGSEANSESCDFIPGPPCENPFVRDTAGAEGYVHVHPGIHGIGDLDPSEHDWRNPVAIITVQRVPMTVSDIDEQ